MTLTCGELLPENTGGLNIVLRQRGRPDGVGVCVWPDRRVKSRRASLRRSAENGGLLLKRVARTRAATSGLTPVVAIVLSTLTISPSVETYWQAGLPGPVWDNDPRGEVDEAGVD